GGRDGDGRQIIRRGEENNLCGEFLVVALIGGGGFLRRDEFPGQADRLLQLLHDKVLPDKAFEILGRQTFRLQNLFYESIQWDDLAVASKRTKQFRSRLGRFRVTHINAEVTRFLSEHQADIDFTVQLGLGEIRVFIRPFAGTEPIKKIEIVSGVNESLLRDFVTVNRTKIAAGDPAVTATAHARWAGAPVNERNNRGDDNDKPQPF